MHKSIEQCIKGPKSAYDGKNPPGATRTIHEQSGRMVTKRHIPRTTTLHISPGHIRMNSNLHRLALTTFALFSVMAIASEPASDHRPVISPDGKTIVFMSTRKDGDWELYSISASGNGLERLTHNEGWDGYAVWAPDSRAFVFQRDVDERRGAYRYDMETGEIEPFVVMEDANVSLSGWSATAGRVVMFIEREGKRDLYLADADGSNLAQLTDTENANEHDAHFSPDGSLLAYAVSLEDGSALDVMELATGEARRYVSSTERLYGLDWSPDGTRIAYTDTPNDTPNDNPDGNAELYLLDVSAGKNRRLTHNDDYDHMPVWLPDGNALMFSSYASGREQIYVLDLESGDVRPFPSGIE